MAKKLALVNGIPRMMPELGGVVTIYDQTYDVVSLITSGTPLTLPAAGSYTDEELEVSLNGVRMDSGVDYSYVGVAPRTQITFAFDLVSNDRVHFRIDQDDSITIYDQTYNVVSTINTGTPISLPNGQTYTGEELEVRLNGVRMDSGIDYNFVGSPPRAQVAFTFDLVSGDDINFRIDRPA